VPQEWLKIIDEFGGAMGETYGVPVEEIAEGIKNGVRKVNIDTDLRMASTGAVSWRPRSNKQRLATTSRRPSGRLFIAMQQ
jgi:fructose-bisphosphate aldolase class II